MGFALEFEHVKLFSASFFEFQYVLYAQAQRMKSSESLKKANRDINTSYNSNIFCFRWMKL